jgi:hypothetical protein
MYEIQSSLNSKPQIPNNFQSPKSKTKGLVWAIEFGIWDLFGVCLPAGRQGYWDLKFPLPIAPSPYHFICL